ncbi:MAG: polyphenol oxidase family protein, partial [Gemmatimonadales bacterium]
MPATVRETQVPGAIPRYELTEWRERYGVVAGITGRPFELGLWSAAPVGEVMTRWRQFQDAMGFGHAILGHQCHKTDIAWHDAGVAGKAGRSGEAGASLAGRGANPLHPLHPPLPPIALTLLDRIDGHATARADTLLLVTLADCIPIYLLEPKKKVIAILHSGWRGTAAGILGKGLALLKERAGVEPKDLVMHLGVGICGKCYEVGAEVIEGVGLRADGDGPWHVDLRERLAHQAWAAGVREITISEWCSAHDNDRFFSHRASKGKDGRMV